MTIFMPRSPHGTCLAFQSLCVRDGKPVKATGYGYANVETRAKATADSLYVIASMTKSLYRRGRFDAGR